LISGKSFSDKSKNFEIKKIIFEKLLFLDFHFLKKTNNEKSFYKKSPERFIVLIDLI
jgi:hypothetical protein